MARRTGSKRVAAGKRVPPVQGPAQGAAIAARLGTSVRGLRTAQGMTVGELAASAGISRAMLSRMENGAVSPSLETVGAIAQALGTSLPALFRESPALASEAQHVPRGQGLEVVRRGTRRGHTYHLLAAERGPRRRFEPFLVTLTRRSEEFPDFEHPGVEFIYLLEGSLRYRHGEESFLLKAGDALTFRGDVPHGPEKLLRLPIRMLSIIMYGDAREEQGRD